MKNSNLLLSLLFIPLFVQAQLPAERHWKKNAEKIRVISYNILNGFDRGKDTERRARFVDWVKTQDPEILALEELCGFTQEKLEKLAKEYGHPYALIHKENGYPVGITSKKPIVLKKKLTENCGHGLLHVETYGYNVLVTHLNPSSTEKRRVEAQTIRRYIQDNNLTHCMLMGDMNSHSPFDGDYLESHSINLLETYGGNTSTNFLKGKIDYSIISTFLSIPLLDACRQYVSIEHRNSFPTPILMGVSKQENIRLKRSERLDYIFVSPDMMGSLVDGFIWNGEPTYYISDHFPVGIDLLVFPEKK